MVDFRAFIGKLRDLDTGSAPINPPLTQTASSHSISIRNQLGLRIGRIQSWSPQMARAVETVWEVNKNAKGEPVERVGQIQGTNTIGIERYEMYTFHTGEAFATPVIDDDNSNNMGNAIGNDLVTLVDQIKPFHIREIWRDPFGSIRAYAYVGCVWADMGITIAATDDRIIKTRATLEFTRKLRPA